MDGSRREVELGRYIAETGSTVRAAAAKFGIGKSTVHKEVTERLEKYDPALWLEVRAVLERNKSERHLRGGKATKEKYAAEREACARSANKNGK